MSECKHEIFSTDDTCYECGAPYWEIIESLQKSIAELESPWIPVSERLPEDEKHVLLFHPQWRIEVPRYRRGSSEPLAIGLCNDTATHWMPLPEPPK